MQTIDELLRVGHAALLAGDTFAARECFRQVLEQNPAQVQALIGMAGAVRPYQEKRAFLVRVLELAPTNADAQASLVFIEAKLAAGEVLAPRGVVAAEPITTPGVIMPQPAPEPLQTDEPTYCYNHPKRETGLRCIQCQRPICGQCSVPAVVGQLCPDCARQRRPINYQVRGSTLAIVVAVSLVTALVTGVIGMFFLGGFFAYFIVILLGPAVAEGIVRLLDRLTRAKRGRSLQIAFGISFGLGMALPILYSFSLPLLLFAIVAISTGVARLR